MPTAQEKLDRALPLTAEDIRELLKDPNSWVAKLYQECMVQSIINEVLFIDYILSAVFAEQQARAEDQAIQRILERAETRQQKAGQFNVDERLTLEKNTANLSLNDLKSTLDEQLMANFNQQVIAQLGPVVVLKSGQQFNTPPLVASIVPVSKVLEVNPGLAEKVTEAPGMQEAFALYHTRAAMGPLGVMKLAKALFEHNNIDESTIDFATRKEVLTIVEKNLLLVRAGTPELFNQMLLNTLLQVKKTLANPSAPKITDVEEEQKNKFRP